MNYCKLLLVVITATVLLGTLASAASARNILRSSQTWREEYREVTFNLPFGNTVCEVTLEGSYHARTMAKVVGALTGYVTRAIQGPCPSGGETILTETLPWHVQYAGFIGTLPNFSALRHTYIKVSTRVREPSGVTCLVVSTTSEPVIATANREAGGAITSSEIGGTVRAGAECFGAAGRFSSNRGRYTVAGAATRVSLTLI